jgi:hypothetical protein
MVTPRRLSSAPLCQTFTAQPEKIWEDLSRAQARGLNRGEETITDDFLDYVQDQHPQEVATFQFNKREEGFTGADWEWWLTDDHLWLGVLVQAKRLRRYSHKYGIKHWVQKAGMWQIDLLLQQARWKGVDPLYCFYNYDSARPDHLTRNCCIPHDWPMFGCMVAHAMAVKGQMDLGGVGLPKMSKVSYPLRCIVCCFEGAGVRETLPIRVHDVVQRLRATPAAHLDFAPRGPEALGLRDHPPPYVRRLLEAALDDRGRVIDELRQEVGEIGSLIVIREPHS